MKPFKFAMKWVQRAAARGAIAEGVFPPTKGKALFDKIPFIL